MLANNYSHHISKIALGTAQFCLPYGVSNTNGPIPSVQQKRILKFAYHAGIQTLDTAIDYANTEALASCGVSQFDIITKVPALLGEQNVCQSLERRIQSILDKLKLKQLYAVLLHKPLELLSPMGEEIKNALEHLKQIGLVKKTGVSVYNQSEVNAIFDKFHFELVQLPLNLFDQSFASSGLLHQLNKKNVEVHARSIFLQGLLLMDNKKMPAYFSPWQIHFSKYRQWLKDENISGLQACLSFVLSLPEISKVVIGVSDLSNIKEIVSTVQDGLCSVNTDLLICNDPALIDPRTWCL